mgnify:CR=1 FL=1
MHFSMPPSHARLRGLQGLALACALLLGGCGPDNNGDQLPDNPQVFEFGFETGLNGFSADGADLEVGGDSDTYVYGPITGTGGSCCVRRLVTSAR